jgi:hypothetical protein
MFKIESAEQRRPLPVALGGGQAGGRGPQPHGLGQASPGNRSTVSRISVPSVTGSSPS